MITHYKVNRARPSFFERLSYFQLDRAWSTALEEAFGGMKPELALSVVRLLHLLDRPHGQR